MFKKELESWLIKNNFTVVDVGGNEKVSSDYVVCATKSSTFITNKGSVIWGFVLFFGSWNE